jgi:ubiquinol-cytochrome c reductase iron-sulfur subunit
MKTDHIGNPKRRRLQLVAGLCALGTGVGIATYLAQLPQPPAGKPTPLDFGDLQFGDLRAVDWNGRTVWILRRSIEQIAALANHESYLTDPNSEQSVQPVGCHNRHRSLRPDIFVAIGQCTHQGCQPQLRSGLDAQAVFLCPCHASKFDLAGRAFRIGPASANLVIPQYRLESETRLLIGAA